MFSFSQFFPVITEFAVPDYQKNAANRGKEGKRVLSAKIVASGDESTFLCNG